MPTALSTSSSTSIGISAALDELVLGHSRLARASTSDLIRLAAACIEGTANAAREWVDAASRYKSVESHSPVRAEDLLNGPVATIRFLRLIVQSLHEIAASGRPRLPGTVTVGADGRLRVPLFPCRGLYDSATFPGFRVDAWMQPGVTPETLRFCPDGVPGRWNAGNPRIALVLGAGNVSSIPTTDAFGKVFQQGRCVLLKMNPVNESLGLLFEQAYAPLIEAGYLRIIYGGADVGSLAVAHPLVDEVHITGSGSSHDAIVWGADAGERAGRRREANPVLQKPITSELGNVTPWIVVPGKYSEAQLDFQAENIATSITNNCSFNCIATKVIITCANWPDRQKFLEKIRNVLDRTAPRKAYYPGAADRFRRFAGSPLPAEPDMLPWTLRTDMSPEASPQHFLEESFVCVCAETALAADSEQTFLDRAVDFVNSRLWGTLAASITLPPDFRKSAARDAALQVALGRLNYGTIALNHWSGLAFAMMSPPWGGAPGSRLDDPQSGIGWVHNTFQLEGVEKSVLAGPLVISPKPMWFVGHRNPEPIAWRLLELYRKPSFWNLSRLVASALRHAG